MSKYFVPLLFLISLSACTSDDTETAINEANAYTPIIQGQERIYLVDSITFDPTSSGIDIDSSRTMLRELVQDTFITGNGFTANAVQRYTRSDTSENWGLQDVVSEFFTDFAFERSERNLRYVKLPSSPKIGLSWDGNTYIDPSTEITIKGETIEAFKNWDFRIAETDIAFEYENFSYDSCVVSMSGSENLLELRRQIEVYSKSIGLVFRELFILDTQITDASIPWRQRAQKGIILRQIRIQ